MISQTIKAWSLFLSSIFTIIAIADYFGAGKAYAPLIATAFIIHLIGEVAVFVINYHPDRRKLELTKAERENWMFKRMAD